MMRARPLIATPDGEVVCGNMRLRALVDLGWTEAPVFVKDLRPAERREWMLRDNQEYGDWVPEELAALVKAHADEAGDLRMLGFSEPKVDNLLKLATEGESDGGGGGGGEQRVPAEVWGVIVECESEDQQAELIERLTEEGLSGARDLCEAQARSRRALLRRPGLGGGLPRRPDRRGRGAQPMIFAPEFVEAVQQGRKTVTRRPANGRPCGIRVGASRRCSPARASRRFPAASRSPSVRLEQLRRSPRPTRSARASGPHPT